VVHEIRAPDLSPGRLSRRVHLRGDGDRHLGLTGPIFGYSDTWQLIINTSTPS